MGFCGMNFFSTRHYGNPVSACQSISARNSIFREKNGSERVADRILGGELKECRA
jgi:hypothetical protein